MQESETLLSSEGWLAGQPPRRWHLRLAILCIVVIYLGGVTGKWWPTPDSALYLGLAKSLAEGHGYQFNGEVSSVVTPGLPLILAALRLLFGEGYWAPNFFVAFCGLGVLWLAYRLISRMSNPRMAFTMVLCCAFSYTFYTDCHLILTDAPFALLFWAALCAAMRAGRGSLWWLILASILTIAALAVRAPGVLVLGPMAIGLLLDQHEKPRRRKMLLLVGVLLVAVVATVGFFYTLGRGISDTLPLYARSVEWITDAPLQYMGQRLGQGILAIPRLMAEMFTGQEGFLVFGLPATAWMIIGGIIVWKRGQRMPLVTIVLYMVALGIVATDDAFRPRYMLPVQPFIAYLVIEGLLWNVWAIGRLKAGKLNPLLYLKVATVFTALVLAVNAPRLARNVVYYSYLSHTPRYYQVIRHGRFAELFEVADVLRQGPSPEISAGVEGGHVSVLHFLSGRLVVGFTVGACPEKYQSIRQKATYKARAIYEWGRKHPKVGFVAINVDTTVKSLIREQEDKNGKPLDEQAKSAARKEFIQRLNFHLLDPGGFNLVHEGRRYHVYQRATQTKRGSEGF